MTAFRGFTASLAFSPNSQRIAYTTIDPNDLYDAPTRGGHPVRLTNDGKSDGVAWGAPGNAFFRYSPSGGDIWLTDGRPHDARRLTHGSDAFLHSGTSPYPVAFSANGRELLADGGGIHVSTVWAIDLPSGHVRQLGQLGGYAMPVGLSSNGKTVLAAALPDYMSTYASLVTVPFTGGKPHVIARGLGGAPVSASWNAR